MVETQPETAQPTTPEPATESIDDQIADLIGGKVETPAQPETVEPKPEPDPTPEKSLLDDDGTIREPTQDRETGPKTVKQLAELAGIDLDQVVFGIDDGDGQGHREISYADVKRTLAASEQLEQDRLTFETEHTKASNQLLAARREFESMVAMVPPENWPPELTAKIAEQSNRTAEYETRMTLASIPSWKDPTVMQADKQDMTGYLAEWGYSPVEVENILDHRALAFVRYHTRLVKRVAELEKTLPGAGKPSKGTQKGRGNSQAQLAAQVQQGAITGDQAAERWLKSIGI